MNVIDFLLELTNEICDNHAVISDDHIMVSNSSGEVFSIILGDNGVLTVRRAKHASSALTIELTALDIDELKKYIS